MSQALKLDSLLSEFDELSLKSFGKSRRAVQLFLFHPHSCVQGTERCEWRRVVVCRRKKKMQEDIDYS